ncbi:MAG TPA: hypothetical protein VF158_05745 [Longimicrobiales bacterium]
MSPITKGAARARLLGALLLAVVFVGGAFSGAVVDRMLASDPSPAAEPSGRDRGDGGDDCGRRRRSTLDRIDLTPEQRARIDQVLERRRVQMDSFWVEARPQLRAIIDGAREEIRAVMTPEQRAEYDRLRAERAARERERERRENKCDRDGSDSSGRDL